MKDEICAVSIEEFRTLFNFLAESFLAPLSVKKLNALLAPGKLSSLRGLLPSLTTLENTLSESTWDAVEEEFHALFSGMRSPALELWESCYLGKKDKRRLLNKLTRDVAQEYRKAGLQVDENLNQPPDHIGIECAFFAHSLAEEDSRSSFFDAHLRPFAHEFCAALEKNTQSRVYLALACLLRESVEIVTKKIMGSGFCAAVGAPESKVPPIGLRPLKRGESKEEPVEIPICGLTDCGSRCPLTAEIADGCVLSYRASSHADAKRVPSLNICARGSFYDTTFLSGSRLRYPMKRTGERGEGKFKRINWDEAVELIAKEVRRIGKEYGPQARYVNSSTGIQAVARGDVFARNLLALDGGYLGRHNTYSTGCVAAATPISYGTNETGNDPKTLLDSKLIILWGHNPVETLFGASLRFYLSEAKKNGIPIVVVDPRFSDTAEKLADRWIGIRPTTDGAMIDAMAYVILDEGLEDREFMDRFCLGFDAKHMPAGFENCENYLDYVFGKNDNTAKTPEWASKITGVSAETIRWLAREYALAKPAALMQGWGPQRHGNGEQVTRSGTLLACLTGNVGISGAWAGGTGYIRQHAQPAIKNIPNPYKGTIPVFLWADAILNGTAMSTQDGLKGVEKLDSGIKMIFNLAGNTLINQHSDIGRTSRILHDTSLCEFIVCSELFLTSSAKYADILLPGTSMFEGENIGSPWQGADYTVFCNKSIEPLFESRFEYDWLSDVARELGFYDQFTYGGKNLREILEESYKSFAAGKPDIPDFEEFRKRGIYRFPEEAPFIAFEENIRKIEAPPFPTPSGKIEIFSPRLHIINNPQEIPAIPKYVPCFEGFGDPRIEEFPFQLIGWHSKRRANSLHDNNPAMERLLPHRVWINPEDAEEKGICDGDLVYVFNDRGKVQIKALITERIVRGVLAIPQGGWYTPLAGADTRGINVLSTARPTPLAKANPQHSKLVNITLCRD